MNIKMKGLKCVAGYYGGVTTLSHRCEIFIERSTTKKVPAAVGVVRYPNNFLYELFCLHV